MKKFGLDYEAVAPTQSAAGLLLDLGLWTNRTLRLSVPFLFHHPGGKRLHVAQRVSPMARPVRTGPPIVDMATGMSACNAILLALLARDRLGRGQHVEVALFDVAMGMTGFYGMAYLINGENPGRFGNSPSGSPTVGVYEASDGPLYMACANDRLVSPAGGRGA